ncbi:phosphatase [Burkholderia sp. ABCPW 11]|uniref:phosphatase n=1 Tax=Burkholderia sp. ABCPW 11 TaxID=1637859 RepID=UPI000754FF1B|nr:phosphatase [Burkholderia sp. ABCPW 11]KVD40880.1 phosphatase [Burkholderia sp. ABCPW 11]
MVIEAIVTRLDAAFAQIEATPDSRESRHQRDAIIRWLDRASEEGYRLGLVTTLPAARLNDMFEGQFGRANLDRFSVVVTDTDQQDSRSNRHPFDVALQALGVPRERAVGVASSEPERREAEHFGLARCVNITDTVRSIASAGLH